MKRKKALTVLGTLLAISVLIAVVLVVFTSDRTYVPSRKDYESLEMNDVEEWGTLYLFEENGLVGYKDADGNVVIEPQFYWAHAFSEGLAFVKGVEGREYQTGYIDLAGNLVIPLPTANAGGRFSEGFAHVSIREWDWSSEYSIATGLPGPFIFIDRMGRNVFGMEFATVSNFEDGLARVSMLKGNMIVIDRTGKNAFGMEFRWVFRFIDGLAIVHLLNGNRAFIDRRGENAFGMEFTSAFEFDRRGYAQVVLLDGTATYIDREGNLHLDRTWG